MFFRSKTDFLIFTFSELLTSTVYETYMSQLCHEAFRQIEKMADILVLTEVENTYTNQKIKKLLFLL